MAMDLVVDLDGSPSVFGYFKFVFLCLWNIPYDIFEFRMLQKLLSRQLRHAADVVVYVSRMI